MTRAHELLAEGALLAGKFRIVRLLGEGGMGAVYEIEHALTKHRRALKLLHSDLHAHPAVVERFLREASAAGRIGDAHIVEVFDAGTLDTGEPYVVLELLEGETLAKHLLREGQLPLNVIVDLVAQASDGVAAAHAAGIVHRDLKPENLFLVHDALGARPFVKLLDFGVSKFDAGLTGELQLTHEGTALGTPLYMSPEQVRGKADLDARADVYALGVILYECAAGQPPFMAASLPELSVRIHEGRPTPLTEVRPDLPQSFVALVAGAMATDRDVRIGTAAELATMLRSLPEVVSLADTAPGPEQPRFSAAPPRRSSAPPAARSASLTPAATSHSPSAPAAAAGRSRRLAVGALVAAAACGLFLALRPSTPATPLVGLASTAAPPLPRAPSGSAAPAPALSPAPSPSAASSVVTAASGSTSAEPRAAAPPSTVESATGGSRQPRSPTPPSDRATANGLATEPHL